MIPEGWKEKRIDTAIEFVSAKSTVQNEYQMMTSSRNGLIPQIEYYAEGRIPDRDNVGSNILPDGCITYRSRSDDGLFFFNRNQSGKTCIISHFYPVFKAEGADPTYLLAALNYNRKLFYAVSVGTSQKVLSQKELGRVKLPFPPLEEQKKIAKVLSTWDQAIETTERLVENAKAQKKALMQQLLTKTRRLPGFQENWREVHLGQLGEFIKGKGISRSEVVDTGLPAIRYGEIYTSHHFIIEEFFSFIDDTSAGQAVKLKTGDILFTCSGETAEEIGKSVAFVGGHAAYAGGDIIILRDHGQSAEFLGYALNSSPVVRQKARFGQGNSVVHISAENLSKIVIQLPPIEEQRAISQVISAAHSELQKWQRLLGQQNSEKAALMQQLLTGKRRVKLDGGV